MVKHSSEEPPLLTGQEFFDRYIFESLNVDEVNLVKIILQGCLQILERGGTPHGQLLQDAFVIGFLGDRPHSFLDIGAGHPKLHSNTYNLETYFGWQGVSVEPLIEYANLYLEIRKSIHFSNAVIPQAFADERIEKGLSMSGELVQASEVSRLSGFEQPEDHWSAFRKRRLLISTPLITVNQIFDKCENTLGALSYLNIDIEGFESRVLKDVLERFGKTIDILTIEHQSLMVNREEFEKVMIGRDYLMISPRLSKWDAWYVSRDLAEERDLKIK